MQRGTITRMMTAFITGLKHIFRHRSAKSSVSDLSAPSWQRPQRHSRTGVTRTPKSQRKHKRRQANKTARAMRTRRSRLVGHARHRRVKH